MSKSYVCVKKSPVLRGCVSLYGAKNAALPILVSLILTRGISTLRNIPFSSDIENMAHLLCELGAEIAADRVAKTLTVDTRGIDSINVCPDIMSKMRASIVVAGPLLARLGKAHVALPGGCVIGSRPIDLHLRGFAKLGVQLEQEDDYLQMKLVTKEKNENDRRVVFEYPSVGATQNIMMLAAQLMGRTTIVNAAHEPEIFDLVSALQKMGACIEYGPGAHIIVTGVAELKPIDYEIMPDRLEAGSLLLAAAVSGGSVTIENGQAANMDMFLEKLAEMGHSVTVSEHGITLVATDAPQAVSFKTGPYPGFPTDLQAPMMAALCVVNGVSVIEETVFENRLMHVKELQKLGAQIEVEGNVAVVRGVDELYGGSVIATDIRASYALALAGMIASGETQITGLHHWRRGFDCFEKKLEALGAYVEVVDHERDVVAHKGARVVGRGTGQKRVQK